MHRNQKMLENGKPKDKTQRQSVWLKSFPSSMNPTLSQVQSKRSREQV